MNYFDDFKKYASGHKGISSLTLHRYVSAQNGYISPTIIEERQLNMWPQWMYSPAL